MTDKPENYWDKLMETDAGAANYMETYGEGPGCETRMTMFSFVEDRETLLDVGCGPGWNYDHFLEYGPAVYRYKGVDYSQRFVRVAKARRPGGQFVVGDCRALDEPDGSWDVVFLQDVLEHTNGYEEPIREALRVSKRRVVISFWRGSFMDGSQQEDKTNDDGDDGWGSDYNREKFEAFLTRICNENEWHWDTVESSPKANRWHRFYIIDKEEKYSARLDDARF